MTTAYYITRYALALVILILTHSLAIIVRPFNRNLSWRILGLWSRSFMRLFNITLTIENENPDLTPEAGGGGGCILISLNQQKLSGYCTGGMPGLW